MASFCSQCKKSSYNDIRLLNLNPWLLRKLKTKETDQSTTPIMESVMAIRNTFDRAAGYISNLSYFKEELKESHLE